MTDLQRMMWLLEPAAPTGKAYTEDGFARLAPTRAANGTPFALDDLVGGACG